MKDIKLIKTILIVDDMPVNLTTIKNILRGNNEYELYSTKTGQEALTILAKNIIDLVLLDIEMPEMDGFQLFEKIKNNKFYNGVPIIFITATATPEIIEKVVNIGARDYLIKPIYADILLEKIHAVFYPTVGEVDPILDVLTQRFGLVEDACRLADVNRAECLITKIKPEKYSSTVGRALNQVRAMLHNQNYKQATKILKDLQASLI